MIPHWHEVKKTDLIAVGMADRHYSREKIGAREMGPPGQKIVLVTEDEKAVWGSHRPAPWTGIKRMDGFDGHSCFIYRNEGTDAGLSSDLIREAVGITCLTWNLMPFITYVACEKVNPIMRHGKPAPGWTFQKAGFVHVSCKKKTKHGCMARLEMDEDTVFACLEEVCA